MHMSGYKRYGYSEDLLPTTHNIQAECVSTDMADSLINGITYGKGSSMIKQLTYLIGWDTFSQGLHIYFKKHAWKNTELPDFIGALQEAYDKNYPNEKLDLSEWAN